MQNKSFQNMQPAFNNLLLKLKSGGTNFIIIVAKLTKEFKWCHTFLEYTLQELEQMVLLNRNCAMLQNLSSEESKEVLWESSRSCNRVEQQTATRLLILVCMNPRKNNMQTVSHEKSVTTLFPTFFNFRVYI